MMKKLLNYFVAIGLIGITSVQVFAQTTNVSANWTVALYGAEWNASTNPNPGPNGVDASADISAQISTLGIKRYSNNTQNAGTAFANSSVAGYNNWQTYGCQCLNTSDAPSLPWKDTGTAGTGEYDPNFYIEYSVTATNNKWLQINTINAELMARGTGAARLVARYSVDGTTEDKFKTFYKTGRYWNNTSAITDVAVSPTSPLTPKRNDNSGGGGSLTLNEVTLKFENLQINVAPGKTFRVRFYPYMSGTSAPSSTGSRGLNSRETLIMGKTSDTALPTDEPLPLDFLSFTAKPSALGNAVNLNWKTTNEVNTKNFEVQSRTANTEFKTIGLVRSKNTSGVHNYAFTDDKPAASTVYYRLKQIDNDGKFKYSDVVAANVKPSLSVTVYPNPVSTVLTVNHSASANRLRITNLQGRKVVEQAIAANTISTEVNVANLNAGTYIVVIEGLGGKTSTKFIKR